VRIKRKIRNNPFARGPKSFFFIVLFFVMSLALLTKLTDYTRHVKNISYSAFLHMVEESQVKSVHIANQDLYGIAHDGTRFETVIQDSPSNVELLRKHGVEFSISPASSQFTIWHFLLFTIFLLMPIALWYFLRHSRGSGSSGPSIFNIGRNRARLFMPSTIKVNFNSVAGASDAKEELKDIIDFLKNPEKYRRIGAKIPRGVLLVGEPGNGKTLLAKAVAGEANCPFFSITGSDFIEVFVGVGAARVRDLFAQARKHAPSIIFIDEIDAIGRQRGSGFGGGHDEREQTLNQLLTEMDGFESSSTPVIILGATNMPDVLDKALLRPGRFDRRVLVPFPDQAAREQILKIHATGMLLEPTVDFAAVAQETAGFTGADLANLLNKAAIQASKKNRESIQMDDIWAAHKQMLQPNGTKTNNSMPLVGGSSRATLFMPSQIKCNFSKVAGMPEAKEELQDVIAFLKDPQQHKRLGAKITRGILLIGDPGNGKTLLAKAVAGEANCPFFSVSASEFIEIFVGVGAARVRDLFAQARKHNPSIIFIDEIDAVGGHRTSGNDEYNQTLNQLLTEMDGFQTDTHSSVIVMAATNRIDTLDKALLRPGRFDRHVYVPYPDLRSREQILQVHASNIKLDPSVDLYKIALGTPGFSGAALANLVNEAALYATKNLTKDMVTIADFEEARDKIILGKESKSKMLTYEDKMATAYHEAGHALVTLLLPDHADPLYKVTIVPRGQALGVTHSFPDREKYGKSKEEMLANIMVCMGGRIAEEITMNIVGTGPANDFEQATKVAHEMIRFYGMSSQLGPVIYSPKSTYGYSEKTAELIDNEVRNILDTCYQKAKELLMQHKDKLEKLTKALLEKETLMAQEVYELLGIVPRKDFSIR
jgi:ATP-dependent metalloprotease FtsH